MPMGASCIAHISWQASSRILLVILAEIRRKVTCVLSRCRRWPYAPVLGLAAGSSPGGADHHHPVGHRVREAQRSDPGYPVQRDWRLQQCHVDSHLRVPGRCPLPLDRYIYYFDTAYWWAYVDDNNASGNVTCQLNSCTDTGTCTSSVTRSSTGVANNQLLSTVGTVFNIGTYTNALFLRCTVPAKVGANCSRHSQIYHLYL